MGGRFRPDNDGQTCSGKSRWHVAKQFFAAGKLLCEQYPEIQEMQSTVLRQTSSFAPVNLFDGFIYTRRCVLTCICFVFFHLDLAIYIV